MVLYGLAWDKLEWGGMGWDGRVAFAFWERIMSRFLGRCIVI